MKKCIMAIMAHADDLEVYAGGTMAKFIAAGYEGVLVMLSANANGAAIGDKKYRETLPAEAMVVREQETREGAAILGVRHLEFLNFQSMMHSDGKGFVWLGDPGFRTDHPGMGPLIPAVAMNPRLLDPVVAAIRKYEPEIVIAQHILSGFEHVCSGHIINLAFRTAMKEGASLGQLWMPMIVRHCTWESDFRLYPSPNILIDITAQWALKEKAMLAHGSQGLEKSVAKIRLANQYWGMARQSELAEPFFTLCDARYR
jgi:LmbE family N-acetylglucosaminyl deacetylase